MSLWSVLVVKNRVSITDVCKTWAILSKRRYKHYCETTALPLRKKTCFLLSRKAWMFCILEGLFTTLAVIVAYQHRCVMGTVLQRYTPDRWEVPLMTGSRKHWEVIGRDFTQELRIQKVEPLNFWWVKWCNRSSCCGSYTKSQGTSVKCKC